MKRLNLAIDFDIADAIDKRVATGEYPTRTAFILAAISVALGKPIGDPKPQGRPPKRSRNMIDPLDVVQDDGWTQRENIEFRNRFLTNRRRWRTFKAYGLKPNQPTDPFPAPFEVLNARDFTKPDSLENLPVINGITPVLPPE